MTSWPLTLNILFLSKSFLTRPVSLKNRQNRAPDILDMYFISVGLMNSRRASVYFLFEKSLEISKTIACFSVGQTSVILLYEGKLPGFTDFTLELKELYTLNQ